MDDDAETDEPKRPSSSGSIIGEWQWEFDMLNIMAEELGMDTDDLGLDSMSVFLILDFNRDGSCTVSLDEDALEEMLDDDFYDAMVEIAYDAAVAELEAQIDAGEIEGTVRENIQAVEEELDMPLRTYLRSMLEEELSMDNIIDLMGYSGTEEGEYEIDEDTLILEGAEFTFEVDGDELILDCDDVPDEISMFMSFPVTLTRP